MKELKTTCHYCAAPLVEQRIPVELSPSTIFGKATYMRCSAAAHDYDKCHVCGVDFAYVAKAGFEGSIPVCKNAKCAVDSSD